MGNHKPDDIAVVLDEDESAMTIFLEMVKHLESGKNIHMGSVSNEDDDTMSRTLYNHGISNNIIDENFEIISDGD